MVRHRNGEDEIGWASMRKSIYSLAPLRQALSVRTNITWLSFPLLTYPSAAATNLESLTQTRVENRHSYKGFNSFAEDDATILRPLLRGEFTISGLSSRAMHPLLPAKSTGQISRLLKRLRVHGVIKIVGHRYQYCLTRLGRQAATLALKLREFQAVPARAENQSGQPSVPKSCAFLTQNELVRH